MYESPIKAFLDRMNFDYDGEILRAVQSVNVTVDKDELIKALRYDRDQYEKGYRDALSEVEIVYCRDCQNYQHGACSKITYIMDGYYRNTFEVRRPDDFCSLGERADT